MSGAGIPGVPQLFNAAIASAPLPVVMIADALGIGALLGGGPQWGLFGGGAPGGLVTTLLGGNGGGSGIVPDSVKSFEFAQDVKISDFPIEGGGFASYNRVVNPFTSKFEFIIGGSFKLLSVISGLLSAGSFGGVLSALTGEAARTAFLNAIDAASKSTALYTIVTPSQTYPNVSVTHYDYRRTAREGATLLTVNVWVEQVRLAAPIAFSSTASPNGAAPVSGGPVQATPVDTPVNAPIAGTAGSSSVPVTSSPLSTTTTPFPTAQ